MFTIQYEAVGGAHKMQAVDTNQRRKLLHCIASFPHPILAVYEQASPITKAVRRDMQSYPGTLSTHARAFAFTMTPA